MYSQFRLTALANKRVELELEKFDTVDQKLEYIDEEIATARNNLGPEMAVFAGNMQRGVMDQMPPEIRKELGFDDPDSDEPQTEH